MLAVEYDWTDLDEAAFDAPDESEIGDVAEWNTTTQRLFDKDGVFRRWKRREDERGSDTSWQAFAAKGGAWDKLSRARWNARHRAKHPRKARNHVFERKQLLNPCETAAIDSSRPEPMARSSLTLLDRMPQRACVQPLVPDLSIFETYTRGFEERTVQDYVHGGTKKRNYTKLHWAAAPTSTSGAPVTREPTAEEWTAYRKLCAQNATCFDDLEVAHPINFFEQRDVCKHCGAERFRTSNPLHCCQGGKLVMDRQMPDPLLSLITDAPGLSKESRAANDLFRFERERVQ